MATKTVEEEAILDLLQMTHCTPHGTRAVMEALASILPELEAGGQEAADAAVRAGKRLAAKQDPDQSQECLEIEGKHFLDYLAELEHYVDKRAVVTAALAKARELEKKADRIIELQQTVLRIFQNLDPRTKAILKIYNELCFVDSYIHMPAMEYQDMLNNVGPLLQPVSLEILEDEPELAPLLEVYEMAKQVREAL